jgi:starvation-inducible outer membrane lipoprotein
LCAQNRSEEEKKVESEQNKFFDYCKQVFGKDFDFVRTKRLAEGYIKKYNYTWSGMLKTLIYFFEVKKIRVSKAKGSIGIIPYTYQEALNHYYAIWQAQQLNIDKKIEDYVPEVIEITIPPPQPKPRKRRLFSFLDKEKD